ncbi:UNKNOWN [Stylonychia lemnae]|uniref:Uncharacterized protein n=1 Tax=Stylonychia lemnae TaxID=5949 RepID=A0A078AGQ2_STYLE|nr:UNKNOWN [Stylonychia lemnae]|eukprot:CDW80038.1 UNKNOWN [Stylonychia lemnae]
MRRQNSLFNVRLHIDRNFSPSSLDDSKDELDNDQEQCRNHPSDSLNTSMAFKSLQFYQIQNDEEQNGSKLSINQSQKQKSSLHKLKKYVQNQNQQLPRGRNTKLQQTKEQKDTLSLIEEVCSKINQSYDQRMNYENRSLSHRKYKIAIYTEENSFKADQSQQYQQLQSLPTLINGETPVFQDIQLNSYNPALKLSHKSKMDQLYRQFIDSNPECETLSTCKSVDMKENSATKKKDLSNYKKCVRPSIQSMLSLNTNSTQSSKFKSNKQLYNSRDYGVLINRDIQVTQSINSSLQNNMKCAAQVQSKNSRNKSELSIADPLRLRTKLKNEIQQILKEQQEQPIEKLTDLILNKMAEIADSEIQD